MFEAGWLIAAVVIGPFGGGRSPLPFGHAKRRHLDRGRYARDSRCAWHAGDFDFFAGDWKIRTRRLREFLRGSDEWYENPGTVSMRTIAGGLANVDDFRMTTASGELFATTLRLFNPETRQWSIYWAATSRNLVLEPPVVGGFEHGDGLFYGPDTYEGVPVLVRFRWRPGAAPTWEQAFSADDGRTWETNWIMEFDRSTFAADRWC